MEIRRIESIIAQMFNKKQLGRLNPFIPRSGTPVLHYKNEPNQKSFECISETLADMCVVTRRAV